MNLRRQLSIGALWASICLFVLPLAAFAQLRVIISGGFSAPYRELIPEFERRSGITVTTTSGGSQGTGPNTIEAQLSRGVPADVVILNKAGLADLVAHGKIVSGTEVDLAQTPLALAVRSGAPKPDIRSLESFRQTLLRARSVTFTSSTTGIYLTTKLFPRLGIADEMSRKSTTDGVAAVGRGDAEMAIQALSELLPVPGIEIVGTIPAEVQNIAVFSAAVVKGSTEIDASKRLIAFLSANAAASAIRKSGMEPPNAPPAFTVVQPELFKSPGALTSAWGDYNNDGRLDVAVTFEHGVVKLYRNDGAGKFTDVSDEVGLGQIVKGQLADKVEVRSAAWGDYDGDGYIDLYVGTRYAGEADGAPPPPGNRSYLFHNRQGKNFEEVAQKMGVDFPAASVRQASWIDYDNNGVPDLYVPDRNGKNRMYHNDGDHFTDVTAQTGLSGPQKSVGVCWFDFDRDGDLDVFVASQEGGTDAFYRNDGGKFIDIAPKLGMDHPGRKPEEGGVGCAVGDYDNDGNLDLIVVTYGESYLYHNNGDGTFSDVHRAAGINVVGEMVGANWGDYDNDGLLDLYISGYKHVGAAMEPDNHLFKNLGGGHFAEVNILDTVFNSADHGVQWLDYDNDGALDISLTDDFSKTMSRHTLLHNDLPPVQRKNALEVTVLDAKGHHTRAGSEVRVYEQKGKLLGTRLVATGDGYNSQGTQPVHFGVPANQPVTVEVTFLTKAGRVTQKVANVRPADYAGKALVIKEKR